MTRPKYPHIKVALGDGDYFSVLENIVQAMRRAEVDPQEVTAFLDDVTSGDEEHLLEVVWNTIVVDE